MNPNQSFSEEYKKLNTAQKDAVDSTQGPVMVIAGPGTGKTQVLALRIANILTKTDTPADGILCLTYTNSGVRAMRERLEKIIGTRAAHVVISTFHSFAASLLEEFYETLSFDAPPKLLDDKDSVLLADELLENNDWEYLRPRTGGAHNFRDLKDIISLLKREGILPAQFLEEIEKDIERVKNDEANISSRGPTKGQLKSEAKEKLERFERTKEAVKFYELYENIKRERGLADYNDILEYIVRLVTISEDIRGTLRERYLYVLVDEHQDSSGVQNAFLKAVWGDIEKPNVFVVGDDRQLIYGFGGASLSHFENFSEMFPGTKRISLLKNYRSTQTILDSADMLLQSTLAAGKLQGAPGGERLSLVEAEYPRDEILAAGLAIKQHLEKGISPNECAVLLPKNFQVKTAAAVLRDMGLQVAAGRKASFFGLRETQSLIRILRVLLHPYDGAALAELLLDRVSGVPFLTAHKFLYTYGKKISVESLTNGEETIAKLGKTLGELTIEIAEGDIYALVQNIGARFFFSATQDNETLLKEIEVVRTMLHLVLSSYERNPKLTLEDFVLFLERLETYGEDIPLAVFNKEEGVKVLTLHGSKGLEFDFVWIAHLDEKSLMKGKRMGFILPESISLKVAKKDELTARRELYVAITRAKRYCTLSYAREGYTGSDQALAKILRELPEGTFDIRHALETEKGIISSDPHLYVESRPLIGEEGVGGIQALVREHFLEQKLSVTHLNNFFSCPWKWYFLSFLHMPEPANEHLEFGDLVHRSVEAVLKDGLHDTAHFPALFEEILNAIHVYSPRARARYMKEAHETLARFITHRLTGISEIRRSEKELKYRDGEIPNIEIVGKIDLVETLPDGTLRVTDFKTGKVKTKREIEKEIEDGRMGPLLRQLSMYSYLLSHEKNASKVSASRLLFLEGEHDDKDALYETHITNEHIERLRKDIKDYEALIKSGEWINLSCDFKPGLHQKECAYCAMATPLR